MQPLESLSTSSLRGFVNELCNRDFFRHQGWFPSSPFIIYFLYDITLTKSFHINDNYYQSHFVMDIYQWKSFLFPGIVCMCDFSLGEVRKQNIPKHRNTTFKKSYNKNTYMETTSVFMGMMGLFECEYFSMCVCASNVCLCVCVPVCVWVCVLVHVFFMRTFECVRVYVCVCVCLLLCLFLNTQMCVYELVCVCVLVSLVVWLFVHMLA